MMIKINQLAVYCKKYSNSKEQNEKNISISLICQNNIKMLNPLQKIVDNEKYLFNLFLFLYLFWSFQ